MAVNRVPVLKRCRSLGLDPIYLGIDKKSTRQLKRANRKVSEYGLQLKEKQKAKFIYGVLEKPFRPTCAKQETQLRSERRAKALRDIKESLRSLAEDLFRSGSTLIRRT